MNVLFVNPPILLPRVFAHYPLFSALGLLSNAAWVRAQGHETRVVDAFSLTGRLNLREQGEDLRYLGAELEQVADEVARQRAELKGPVVVIVGLTMFSEMNRLSENLIVQTTRKLRERAAVESLGMADLYVCGMNYFPYDPRTVLQALPEADWLLVGEGEPTLPELLARLESGASLAGLPRVAFRHKGTVQYSDAAPEAFGELDRLPAPAFDLLNLEHFFCALADGIRADLVHEYHVPERQLPLMTSRSCPFRCNFCTNQVLALPWRAHSVEYVRTLTKDLRDRYQVERFLFLDDNINVDQERFRRLVSALAEASVPWDAVNGYRADRLDESLVLGIKAAGNTKITVSAESGDPELLQKVIHKGLKLSAVVDLARTCAKHRIPLQVHYIVGVPGETRTQINKTLEFATMLFEQEGAWPLLQHAIPFPGTQLFRDCEARGYFVAPPFEIPGALLEVESIIRTPQFLPQQVMRMKKNAQHLHAALQSMTALEVPWVSAQPVSEKLDWARFLGARELFLLVSEGAEPAEVAAVSRDARARGYQRVVVVLQGWPSSAEAIVSLLWKEGLDALVVELHAPSAEAHDLIAGRAGSFARTLRGVVQVLKLGLKHLEVRTEVVQDNSSLLLATVQTALRLRATKVHLQIPAPDSKSRAQVVSWEAVEEPLLEAVRSAPRGRVTVQGAPLCLLPQQPGALEPSPPWVLQKARRFRAKLPSCQECVGYILCTGVYGPEHDSVYRMVDRVVGNRQ